MNIGTQLICVESYGPLVGDRRYYLLANQARLGRVLLIWYGANRNAKNKKSKPETALVHHIPSMLAMDRNDFEAGLISGRIVRAQEQQRLPPWLNEPPLAEGTPPIASRPSSISVIRARRELIAPAIAGLDRILNAPNPMSTLNEFGVAAKTNLGRFRRLFLAFVLSGLNESALAPTYHLSGRWDRAQVRATPYGRPATTKYAPRALPLNPQSKALILDSYRRFHGIGVTRTALYRKCIRHAFGAKAARNEHGVFELFHPRGMPIPTIRQFEYVLIKEFGRDQLLIDRRGKEWFRNRHAMSRGRYSQNLSNLLEYAESDGYVSKEMAVDSRGSPLDKLITVRLVDVLSGVLFGVGFSGRGENEQAYLGALFCAAIGLRAYLELFGMTAGDLDTPGPGLMAKLITDRGPGGGENVSRYITYRQLTPAYSGQSKATIESLHPRRDSTAEAPTYTLSALSPVGMARQELLRTVTQNHTTDASERLTPEMVAANVTASPMAIWTYLNERGRTAAHSIPLEEAARCFLKPVKFGINRDGLRLHGLRFTMPVVTNLLLTRYLKCGYIDGYCLPMCVRYAWVLINGELQRVEALLSYLDDNTQLYITLTELEKYESDKRQIRSNHTHHSLAAKVYSEDLLAANHGAEFDSRKTRKGRAPRRKTRSSSDPFSGT